MATAAGSLPLYGHEVIIADLRHFAMLEARQARAASVSRASPC